MLFDKSSDQAQQLLLFWTLAATEEARDFLMLDVPSRSRVGFVTDEYSA